MLNVQAMHGGCKGASVACSTPAGLTGLSKQWVN